MQPYNRDQVYKAVDAFCDEYIDEEKVRMWCASQGAPRSFFEAFYASELGSYCLPPQAGGIEASFTARADLIARLSRRCGAVLPFLTDMTAMALLSTMRSASQQEIVTDLAARNGRVSFSQAFSEGGQGSDSKSVATEVTIDEGGLFLDGAKTYVANGQFVPETLVLAHDLVCGEQDGGMSLWLVPLSAGGVCTYPLNTIGQEMLAPARIEFEHVKLDPEWQIQTDGKLKEMLEHQYELGRILVCATSLGLAQAAMDDALEHCVTRRSNGRYLGCIPQVETMLANMAAKIRSMETFVTRAAESVSNGSSAQELSLNCSLMKYYVPKTATEVASDALQIFGGAGYTQDTRVSRIWRDCRGNQLSQGSDEMMVHSVAKGLLSAYASTLKDI